MLYLPNEFVSEPADDEDFDKHASQINRHPCDLYGVAHWFFDLFTNKVSFLFSATSGDIEPLLELITKAYHKLKNKILLCRFTAS